MKPLTEEQCDILLETLEHYKGMAEEYRSCNAKLIKYQKAIFEIDLILEKPVDLLINGRLTDIFNIVRPIIVEFELECIEKDIGDR